eukprot:TRINITY_DN45638_c0_g1_i1.p1 TRINITY_DN45638_c0_g1~~TRINITY_DN45638_c0_g1_i1.p1  ORF type:complete len:541 (+),score=118.57 TRINITY_DN45638_c0_g1_i1:104-1726(+)
MDQQRSEDGCDRGGGSSSAEFRVGDAVEVYGLQGAKELNGRRGVIVKFVEGTDRLGVHLDGDADSKAVRPGNLRRLASAPWSPSSDAGPATLRERRPQPQARPMPPQPPCEPSSPSKPPREAREPRQLLASRLPAPVLPEWPTAEELAAAAARLRDTEPTYSDEGEYPDPTRVWTSARVAACAFLAGAIVSQADLLLATWLVWSFLLVHVLGALFLTDCAREDVLLALCGFLGCHSGFAASELILWFFGRDGVEDSVGPWSLLVIFASLLYLINYWAECSALPPDYITAISLFFPMFPAFNAAIVMSAVEMFLEWRWFPEYKFWWPPILLGILLMVAGQALIVAACRTSGRNFWASCRNAPEEEENPEDFVGLEIPNRCVVQVGPYRGERHPAYLGALLWGVGAEVALCNPLMLLIVGFVLWASLLYVTMEEEQELHEEFRSAYATYSELTRCWIPFFEPLLRSAAFQRELTASLEAAEAQDEAAEEAEPDGASASAAEGDDDEAGAEEDAASDDGLLWEGVPRGGALWNRQFREPWMLG